MNYIKNVYLKQDADLTSYPCSIPAIRSLLSEEGMTFGKPVTFFIGENGTGKSTLLEAIAVAMGFNAEGGSRDFQFSTADTHSDLFDHLRVSRSLPPKDGFFLRAESFYNAATFLDQNSTLMRYGIKELHRQSHGEAFLALIVNRFEGDGLYLLDEPESALSPQRLLSLLVAIDSLVKRNSQLIIATHSPILMAYPGADIVQFTENGFERIAYKETEHYRLTRQFLDDPERMLHYLLDQ